MKKAAKILILISAILSIVAAVTYLSLTVLLFAVSSGGDWMQTFVTDNNIQLPEGVTVQTITTFATVLGVTFLVFAFFAIFSAVISFMARFKNTKGLFITVIVLSVLSSTLVGVVGGIFALIKGGVEEEPKAIE